MTENNSLEARKSTEVVEPLERPEEVLSDSAAESIDGGLLLPAVQKVREAAARMSD